MGVGDGCEIDMEAWHYNIALSSIREFTPKVGFSSTADILPTVSE